MPLETQHKGFLFDTGIDQSADEAANESGLDDVTNLEFKRDQSLRRRPGFIRADGAGTIPAGTSGTLVGSPTTKTPALLRAWDILIGRDTITSQSGGIANRVQDAAHAHIRRAAYVTTGESIDSVQVATPTTASPVMAVAVRTVEDQLPTVAFFRSGELIAKYEVPTAASEIRLMATPTYFILVYREVGTGNVSALSWAIGSIGGGVPAHSATLSFANTVAGSLDAAAGTFGASLIYASFVDSAGTSSVTVASWDGSHVGANASVAISEGVAMSVTRVCQDPTFGNIHTLAYRTSGADLRLRMRASNTLGSLAAVTITPTRSLTQPHGVVAYHDPNAGTDNLHLSMQLPEPTTSSARGYEWGFITFTASAYGSYANSGVESNMTPLSKPFVLDPYGQGQPKVTIVLGRQHDSVGTVSTLVPASDHRAAVLCTVPVTSTDRAHSTHPEPIATVLNDGAPLVAHPGNVAVQVASVWYVGLPIVVGVGLRDARASSSVDAVFQFDGYAARIEWGLATDLPVKERRAGAIPRAYGGGVSYLGGGLLRFIDGANVGEQAPFYPPDIIVSQVTGTGVTPAGTYTYVAVASWTDNSGRLHRSAVSPAVAITVDGASNHCVRVVVNVPNLSMLLASDTPENWRLSIYRAVGSTFWLRYTAADVANTITLTEDNANPGWSSGSGFASNGFLADTDLDTATNNTAWTEPAPSELYSTGGVLEQTPPPAPFALWTHGNRLWLVNGQDPQEVWFSKEFENGIAAEFSDSLTARVEGDGPIRTGASLDDKCLLFTDGNVYAISTAGGGPSATNTGAFPPPELVARGVGCGTAHGAVSTPLGVLFLSASGFKLLGSDMAVQDIGRSLLDITDADGMVRDSLHVPERQQVWFVLHGDESRIHVFDYARGKMRWSHYVPNLSVSGTPAVHSLAYLAQDTTISATPSMLVESNIGASAPMVCISNPAVAYDQASAAGLTAVPMFVPASVMTQWMRPDGLIGDCRVRMVHWTARRVDACAVTVTVFRQQDYGYDEESSSEARTWNAINISATGDPIHRRMRLAHQRAKGVRVRIDLAQGTAAATAGGIILNGIELEFGVRSRAAKTGPNVAPTS